MKLAQTFAHIVNQYDEYDQRGTLEFPYSVIEAWRARAVKVEYPLGTDSLDPTELWRFEDGSVVSVDNPRQVVFSITVLILTE